MTLPPSMMTLVKTTGRTFVSIIVAVPTLKVIVPPPLLWARASFARSWLAPPPSPDSVTTWLSASTFATATNVRQVATTAVKRPRDGLAAVKWGYFIWGPSMMKVFAVHRQAQRAPSRDEQGSSTVIKGVDYDHEQEHEHDSRKRDDFPLT